MKIIKNSQTGCSLLTECGADEPIFLSDVYKKHTQAKKYQSDAPQCGRSMVEMLGVLAIIGVLSVGAVAGYSKAMFNYKINKSIDDISNIVSNVRTAFNGKYEGLDSRDNIDLIKKLNLVPDNMLKGNEIIHSFGGNISLMGLDTGDFVSFSFHYSGLSEDACIKLATQNWASDSGFLVVGASANNGDVAYISDVLEFGVVDIFDEHIEGSAYTAYWEGPMSIESASLGCTCPDNNCSVMLGYK